MALTKYQKSWRTKRVGASDVPALFLPDWYKTAGDVYLEKIGAVTPGEDDHGPTSPAYIGTVLEESIINWAIGRLGIRLGRRNMMRVHPTIPLGATLDYQIDKMMEEVRGPIPLEVKTAGIMGRSRYAEEWGDDMTDEVPTHVMLQVHAQMACVGADEAYVAALVAFRGLVLYHIRRCQEIIDAIEEAVSRFWGEYVVPRRPPPNATLETLSKVARVSGETAVVSRELIEQYQGLGRQIRELESRRKEMKEWLIRELEIDGRHVDHGMTEDEWWEVDYALTRRKAYTVPEKEYRVLRIRKGPGHKLLGESEDDQKGDMNV